MNQSKVLKVITAASLAAALSVAFTACGDESSSTSPDPTVQGEDSSSSVEEKSSSSNGKIENSSSSEETNASSSSEALSSSEQSGSSSSTGKSYKPTEFKAECQSDKLELYETETNLSRLPTATRIIGDDGSQTIITDEITTNCGAVFETPDLFESGDTLYVHSEVNYPHGMANCICPTRISFKIEDSQRFSKAKTLVFNNEDTFTLETASSSTLTASSVSGVCLNNDFYDPEVDGAVPPVAYMKVDSDSATLILERVQASCEFINGFTGPIELPITSSIDITAVDDTLYLKPKVKQTTSPKATDCVCPSRLTFKVKADPSIANAKVIVMDDGLNTGNKLRIIMAEDYIRTNPINQLEQYGLSRGACMEKIATEKSSVDGLPQADLTVYENGRAVLQMNFVEDYCDITAKVSQKVVNDTLFLDYYDITSASKCTCTIYNHTFDLKLENTGARYVKFKEQVFYLVPITYTKIPNWDL